MAAKSNVTFEVTEEFLGMTESQQDHSVKAFISANPGATVRPVGKDGGLPPYLIRQSGKRFEINVMMSTSIDARKLLTVAKPLGGGYRDISAGVAGGYGRTSKSYGTSFITLSAAS
jgi:hypothetical protein